MDRKVYIKADKTGLTGTDTPKEHAVNKVYDALLYTWRRNEVNPFAFSVYAYYKISDESFEVTFHITSTEGYIRRLFPEALEPSYGMVRYTDDDHEFPELDMHTFYKFQHIIKEDYDEYDEFNQ